MKRLSLLLALVWLPNAARAQEGGTVADSPQPPVASSRLFSMPIADVIGAYHLSLSGDGSLLQQPGLLTSAGVIAIGVGDIAQLEYRNSAAVGATGVEAPIPAIGVQLKLPFADRKYVPAFAGAFRLGVPRREKIAGEFLEESVTDLYLVGRLHLWGTFANVTLHGGTRISSATAQVVGTAESTKQKRSLYLPAGGWEWRMNPQSRLVGEVSLAPQFRWNGDPTSTPVIDYGLLGRLGLRWQLVRWATFDGSIGYQVEVNRSERDSIRSLVQWDIRLGAEIFVPWGTLACRSIGAFCDR